MSRDVYTKSLETILALAISYKVIHYSYLSSIFIHLSWHLHRRVMDESPLDNAETARSVEP